MAHYTITDGPSKFDLTLSLVDKGCRREVDFLVKESLGPKVYVVINELTREDDSGESWLFRGYAGTLPVNGYYSTRSRKGWIEI